VKRLIYALKKHGDKAVVHGLRGKPSNRKIEEKTEREAVKILSAPVYEGFGPTLAAEYLGKKHGMEVYYRRRSRREVKFSTATTTMSVDGSLRLIRIARVVGPAIREAGIGTAIHVVIRLIAIP